MHAIVQWLANLNIKRNMTSVFVNKKHRYTFQSRRYSRSNVMFCCSFLFEVIASSMTEITCNSKESKYKLNIPNSLGKKNTKMAIMRITDYDYKHVGITLSLTLFRLRISQSRSWLFRGSQVRRTSRHFLDTPMVLGFWSRASRTFLRLCISCSTFKVIPYCASLLRTIFALAHAHERVHVQNVRDFPQTTLDSKIEILLIFSIKRARWPPICFSGIC